MVKAKFKTKKKQCNKGWGCGLSCISKNKGCRITAKEKSKELLSKIAKVVAEGGLPSESLSSLAKKKSWSMEDAKTFRELFTTSSLKERQAIDIADANNEEAKETIDRLSVMKEPAPKYKPTGPKAPLVNNNQRQELREHYIKKFFGGDLDLVKRFEKDLTDFVSKKTVKIAFTPEVIDIINNGDGKIKNLHETGTSGGFKMADKRLNVENHYMGYSKSSKPEDLPKYGFVSTPLPYFISGYGDEVFEIELPKDRYTVTIGDSLGGVYSSRPDDVKIESFGSDRILEDIAPGYKNGKSIDFVFSKTRILDYIEAQITGELKLADFRRIEYDDDSPEKLFREEQI